jgi:photosystem II stability/assembly factor-like uncharacterized protein
MKAHLAFLVILLGFSQSTSAQIWRELNSPHDQVYQLIIGREQGEIYVYQERLYASSDEGKSWRIVMFDDRPIRASRIVADSSGSLLVVEQSSQTNSNTALYRVSQKGQRVELLDTNDFTTYIVPLITLPSGAIIGCNGFDSLFRSRDRGVTWEKLNQVGNVAVADKDGRMYVNRGWQTLSLSTDEGDTWTPIDLGLKTANYVSPVGNKLFITGAYQVVSSLDFGSTLSDPQPFASSFNLFYVVPNSAELYLANSTYGFYRSYDRGETWEPMSAGLPHSTFYSAVAKGDRVYVMGNFGSAPVPYKLDLQASSVAAIESELSSISIRPLASHVEISSREQVIRVYNAVGQSIATGQNGKLTLHRSELVAGVYFIRAGDLISRFIQD